MVVGIRGRSHQRHAGDGEVVVGESEVAEKLEDAGTLEEGDDEGEDRQPTPSPSKPSHCAVVEVAEVVVPEVVGELEGTGRLETGNDEEGRQPIPRPSKPLLRQRYLLALFPPPRRPLSHQDSTHLQVCAQIVRRCERWGARDKRQSVRDKTGARDKTGHKRQDVAREMRNGVRETREGARDGTESRTARDNRRGAKDKTGCERQDGREG